MYGRALFIVYIATFILTWPDHFAVRGTPKTRKEQCKELDYAVACTFTEKLDPCQVLTCGHLRKKYGNLCQYMGQPIIFRNGVPDYTECSESKICMKGRCVTAPMPHYRSRVDHVPCTKRQPVIKEPVPTRREQCQRLGFDVSCLDHVSFAAPTSCLNLQCGYKASDEFFLYEPSGSIYSLLHPLTGTRCGSNGVCFKRKCIPLNEWLLSKPHPTYTGQENWDICREVNN